MIDPTRTTTVLLDGLHDPANDTVWSEFDRRYRPIVMGFAIKLGLNEADAADVAQDTLARFVQEYRAGQYDRSRGRLRSWLIGLAKYRLADMRRRQATRREFRGDSAMIDLSDDQRLTVIWEEQERTSMLREALDQLRSGTKTSTKTIRAFELLAINQMPVEAVATDLGMTTHDVYVAKSRVARRLREILESLTAAYEQDA